jgi:iron-sulfur cluster protein
MRVTTIKSAGVESPRALADKSDRQNLIRAIHIALEGNTPAIRKNTQTFNRNRYRATSSLPDYEQLKDRARQIKEDAIARLPDLIVELKTTIGERGGCVFLAPTAQDACNYILNVCRERDAQLAVKGKSMTSEEIHLNRALEAAGIEITETDLGEFILQLADEQPCHLIAPALHWSRDRITELFKSKFQTDLPLDTPEELTNFARDRLRDKFFQADVGITGANLIAADTGTLMLVESEGNIRMSSFLPPVHIAIAGVEKIIPTRADMAPFLELLAPSATGQKMSSYTSFISPPIDVPVFAGAGKSRGPREFHLVLVDNGRMRMRDDSVMRETLYCIRCSACLNSCANFQTAGGHAFGGETYSGGIGGSWEAGIGKIENARFSELCTGCSRCINQCPVRIDIPWLNENLAGRLNRNAKESALATLLRTATAAESEDAGASASRIFFGNYHWFAKWGARFAPASNALANMQFVRRAMESCVGLDHRRVLPRFARRPLTSVVRKVRTEPEKSVLAKAVLFADVFTNYTSPHRGIATVRILRALDVDVAISESLPDGRTALSQGMISTAKKQAGSAAESLQSFLEDDRDIVIVEPSSLAMFRRDFRQLLDNPEVFELLRTRSFEPVEYIVSLIQRSHRNPREIFDVSRSPIGARLFFHPHCQQKTIGGAACTETLLRDLGFDVATSTVECCGMAGSFGYKSDFYELSMAVGADLFLQVTKSESESGPRALIASGTSCAEQLNTGLRRQVLHPVELLAAILVS